MKTMEASCQVKTGPITRICNGKWTKYILCVLKPQKGQAKKNSEKKDAGAVKSRGGQDTNVNVTWRARKGRMKVAKRPVYARSVK